VSSRQALVVSLVVASLAAGAAAVALTSGIVGDAGISDTVVYRQYGERIADGHLPYRDFDVEYPPGALVPFVVPAVLSSSQGRYDDAFAGMMLAGLASSCLLVVISLKALRASWGRVAFSVGALLTGVVFLGPFVLTRFDLYAVAVTLAAICAILHRRRTLGPVLLGLAIATKIYPAVVLPLLAGKAWKRDGRSAAIRETGLAVGVVVAVYLPFALVAPGGVVTSVWRQLGRPLQIESLGSAVLLALHHAAGMPLGWASGSGSQNLTGTVSSVASAVTTIAGVAALALVWMRYWGGDTESGARFVRYAAAATVAFVCFGKVLSPQFLVWLLPIVVLVQGVRGAIATILLLSACLLTRTWFPHSYWALVKEFDPTASWLVLVRDVVLVALFAVLVVRVRAREPVQA
jgi:Glycosyltransferase family 87